MSQTNKACYGDFPVDHACATPPTWSVKKVTAVDAVTGEKRYGYECWACDEHKDAVIARVTHAPEVTRLVEGKP